MNLFDLLKLTGIGAGGAATACLFIWEIVVPGKRYRQLQEDNQRLIDNGERWEKRYFETVEAQRRQTEVLAEALALLKAASERQP